MSFLGESIPIGEDARLAKDHPDGVDAKMRPRSKVEHLTYIVYCHVCKHGEDRIPRNKARSIGSPKFGALWHCKKHQDGASDQCRCPFGSWTEEPVT